MPPPPFQAVVLDLPLGPAARGGAVGGRAVPVEGVRWRREGRTCGGSKVRGRGVTWHQVRAAAVVAALVPVMVVGLLWLAQGVPEEGGSKTGHCTVPYCTLLHCTALHCTALHWPSIIFIAG